MGMRKDFLSSAEEKQQKKRRVDDHRDPPIKSSQPTKVSPIINPESNDETLTDIDQVSHFPITC